MMLGLHANAMYTTGDLRRLGIGTVELDRARRAGVEAVMVGRKNWYYGGELIRWMQNKDSVTKGASDGMELGQDAHFSTELVPKG